MYRPNGAIDRWVQWHRRCIDAVLYEPSTLEKDAVITCLQCLTKESLATLPAKS